MPSILALPAWRATRFQAGPLVRHEFRASTTAQHVPLAEEAVRELVKRDSSDDRCPVCDTGHRVLVNAYEPGVEHWCSVCGSIFGDGEVYSPKAEAERDEARVEAERIERQSIDRLAHSERVQFYIWDMEQWIRDHGGNPRDFMSAVPESKIDNRLVAEKLRADAAETERDELRASFEDHKVLAGVAVLDVAAERDKLREALEVIMSRTRTIAAFDGARLFVHDIARAALARKSAP